MGERKNDREKKNIEASGARSTEISSAIDQGFQVFVLCAHGNHMGRSESISTLLRELGYPACKIKMGISGVDLDRNMYGARVIDQMGQIPLLVDLTNPTELSPSQKKVMTELKNRITENGNNILEGNNMEIRPIVARIKELGIEASSDDSNHE